MFPPVTTHVRSIPVVTFMALLVDCERSFQLFRYAKGGTVNLRALGSCLNETFFSGLRDIDITNQGVLRPDQIPKAMSTACLLMESRLDDSRGFYMKTTKRCPVYNIPSTVLSSSEAGDNELSSQEQSPVIEIRSHPAFGDNRHRRRLKKKPLWIIRTVMHKGQCQYVRRVVIKGARKTWTTT